LIQIAFLAIIEFDQLAYNKKHNSRAVKKTLSIPEWLNEEAIALGVNFSQVLQEALIQRFQNKITPCYQQGRYHIDY